MTLHVRIYSKRNFRIYPFLRSKTNEGENQCKVKNVIREIFTPDEVRKLDNKKCIIFIRGFDPILDEKFIPFAHPMFDMTADGKGEPYIHNRKVCKNIIGKEYEILSKKAISHFERLKDKGENVYIDTLTYNEFKLLGEIEMKKRFTNLE